jgi:hypothetical protein
MSPLVRTKCLSSRCSRERHCDRDVVPLIGGIPFPRFGHFASTFLLPFAPPRFAARLHRYYESSDFYRVASSDAAGIAPFVPCRRAILRRRAWAIGQAVSPAAVLAVRRPRPVPDRSPCLSRLNFRPFRLQPPHRHFVTVALTRYFTAVTCHVYPPGRLRRSVRSPSRGQGFGHSQQPPRQAWPNRVHLRYGLVVRLRLLSTFPHGNAVTLSTTGR